MALKSGLGAQLGIAPEVAYGTFVAPTTFYPFTSEGLTLEKQFVRSQGLRANRFFQSKPLHVATTRAATGAIVMELLNKGMGKLFNLLHGNTVAPVQVGGSTAYLQTHNIGTAAPDGKSASVQVGRPDTGGTVRAFSYKGCKVVSWQISLEASGLATCTFTLDGRDEVTSEVLGSATYAADAVPFNFTQGVVKVDGVSIGNVRSITIEGSQPQAVDRYHLGNSGIKDEPIVNAFSEVTASTVLEFASLADHDRFKNETVVGLALELTGAVIAGANSYFAKITLDSAKQVSSGPTVDGPDIITTSASFEALDDGTDPPVKIEYQSTDTAL